MGSHGLTAATASWISVDPRMSLVGATVMITP
jgi:hypothetical protein